MPRLASDTRWTWIFATILILVVVVVIGFLSGITSALSSIDDALGDTDETLVEVNDDADPLPELRQDDQRQPRPRSTRR